MDTQGEKYNSLIKILRNSAPDPGPANEIADSVMKRISAKKHITFGLSYIPDFLFGWVYVPWVRTSFVALSFIMVAAFILQQNRMQKQIDFLTKQMIVSNRVVEYDPSEVLRVKKIMYQLYQERSLSDSVTISEKQLGQILDSITDLSKKYREIMNVINEDPVLKKKLGRKLDSDIRLKYNL